MCEIKTWSLKLKLEPSNWNSNATEISWCGCRFIVGPWVLRMCCACASFLGLVSWCLCWSRGWLGKSIPDGTNQLARDPIIRNSLSSSLIIKIDKKNYFSLHSRNSFFSNFSFEKKFQTSACFLHILILNFNFLGIFFYRAPCVESFRNGKSKKKRSSNVNWSDNFQMDWSNYHSG